MRGQSFLILVHGIKVQGQLCHSTCKKLWLRYKLKLLYNHIQVSNTACLSGDEKRISDSVLRQKLILKECKVTTQSRHQNAELSSECGPT